MGFRPQLFERSLSATEFFENREHAPLVYETYPIVKHGDTFPIQTVQKVWLEESAGDWKLGAILMERFSNAQHF